MTLDETPSLLSLTPRLAGVLTVLTRHGFAKLLRGHDHWPPPAEARRAFEELGVVFCKFGQVLSTRADLLPAEYVEELTRLQDHLPPEEASAIRKRIAAELGRPIEQLFASFEDAPLAAATIAQVHAARLPDGTDVVVKVQREGLQRVIAEDVAVLAYLAAMLESISPAVRAFDPPAMVREFHQSLLRELDFLREADNVRRFRSAFGSAPGLWIPAVIDSRSTRQVITFNRSKGQRIDAWAKENPVRRREMAERLAALFLRQVLEEGFFHADPHPGNLFVLPDGRVCLHDFGLVGQLDPQARDALVRVLECTLGDNASGAVDAYLDLGFVSPDVDRGAFEQEVIRLARELREQPVSGFSVGHTLEALLRLGTKHRIRNPSTLVQLARTFITLESVLRDLDPSLNLFEFFRDHVPRIRSPRAPGSQLASEVAQAVQEMGQFLRHTPHDARRLLRRAADGDLGTVRVREHASVSDERKHAIDRLVRTIAAGFLVLAGSVLLHEDGWRLAAGFALMVTGLGGLAWTALNERLHR